MGKYTKLPKKIAGFKIPKALRLISPKKIAGVKITKLLRKNSLLGDLLGSAAGRRLLADFLVAAAAAAAALLTAASWERGTRKAGADVADSGQESPTLDAIKGAIRAMTESLSGAVSATVGTSETTTTGPAALNE